MRSFRLASPFLAAVSPVSPSSSSSSLPAPLPPARRRAPAGAAFAGLLACAWLLLLAAGASPAAAQDVDRVRVEVEVAGEESLLDLDKTLTTNIELLLSIEDEKKEDDLTEGELRRLHARASEEIAEALEPFGYYRPVIRSSLTREGTTWTARYEVEPGPPLEVSAVDVRLTGPGTDDPGFREIAEGFPLAVGDRLVHPEYEGAKDDFAEYAAAHGYLDASFETAEIRIDREAYTAEIELEYATGEQYLFGPLTFHQSILHAEVLEGYIQYEEGDPLDLDVLLELQDDLSDSPYFQRVEVLTRPEEAVDRRVPIHVEMVPAARQKWDLGVGYGTDTGPRGRAALDLRRINRRGHRGNTEVTLSEIESSAAVQYLIPGYYPRTDVTTFTLGYLEERPDTSSSETFLAGVGRTRSRGRWREAYGLTYQRADFEVGVDEGTSALLIPQASWSRVKADDRLYPRNGLRVEFKLSGAEEALLSDSSFVQLTASGKYIYALSEDVRVIGRLTLGRTWTSDFRDLPPRIRFFAGGDESVRGYAYQEIGPLDEEGNVIGGESLLAAGVEFDSLFLDFGRLGRWGAAVFYDVGGAGMDLGDRLEQGAGAGIRWLSPIGLVRLDAAVALTEPGSPVRFHVMIGPDL